MRDLSLSMPTPDPLSKASPVIPNSNSPGLSNLSTDVNNGFNWWPLKPVNGKGQIPELLVRIDGRGNYDYAVPSSQSSVPSSKSQKLSIVGSQPIEWGVQPTSKTQRQIEKTVIATNPSMAGVDPVQVAGVSENNLQRIQDVIGTSLVRRSGVDQTPAPSNEVAQVFPTYGSIFFPTYGSTVLPPYRIAKYRTDHIIIGSFDPNSFLKLQGGGAGWFHKYIDGPLASMATNTRVISDDESRTFVGILNKLDAQKKLNNGQPLARISLMSHGSSAGVSLGNNQIYNVRQIVAGIMDTNLLKPGGRLVLGGCSIADTPEACAELSKVAKRFKIIIQASEIDTVGGSGNLAHKTFFPDGKVTRNVGPFAPF